MLNIVYLWIVAQSTIVMHIATEVSIYRWHHHDISGIESRFATVRGKYLENEIFSRSGKSQGILWIVREI